ncbi:MAG: hypothetical protein M1836_004621 [Candelina mexicana]|nr:MAG: hypothetical protein M1836_004621 [Candelina mexicana]
MATHFGNMAPLSLLSTLQNRIAVLEVELRHSQAEKVAAYDGSRYLLNLLTSTLNPKESEDPHYYDELHRVKARLQATKLENVRLKSKLRKASVGHILASRGIKGTKFLGGDARSDEGEHQGSQEPSETLLDDPTPVEIIDRYPAATSFSSAEGSLAKSNSPPQQRSALPISPGQHLISLETYEADSYAFLADPQGAPHSAIGEGKHHKPPPPYVQFFADKKVEAGQNQVSQEDPQCKENTLFSYSDDDNFDSDPSIVRGNVSNDPTKKEFQGGSIHIASSTNGSNAGLAMSKWAMRAPPTATARINSYPMIGPRDHISTKAKDLQCAAPGNDLDPLLSVSKSPVIGQKGLDVSTEVAKWVNNFNQSGSSQELIAPKASRPYIEARVKEPRYGSNWGAQKIFRSEDEHESTLQNNQRTAGPKDRTFPDLFRFGLRYQPLEREADALRTVMVSNLPHDVTMNAVLDKIRGGMVVWASLLDSVKIKGSMSAMVTFLHPVPAAEYVDFAREHPVQVCGQTITVDLLPTPTWPMAISLKKAIYDHGHTRCLEIINFPRRISRAELMQDLRISESLRINMIESLEMSQEGILSIRFTGVHYAGQAYGKLTAYRKYFGIRVTRTPDPCALPLETLLESALKIDNAVTTDIKLEDHTKERCGLPKELPSKSRTGSVIETSSEEESDNREASTGATSIVSHSDDGQGKRSDLFTKKGSESFFDAPSTPHTKNLDPSAPNFKPTLSPASSNSQQCTFETSKQTCSPDQCQL